MTTVLDAFYASDDWRSGPREDIIGSIETSTKTVMNLPPKSVEGCGCNRRLYGFTRRILSVSKFSTMKSTTLNKKRARIVLSALEKERKSDYCGSFRDLLLCLIRSASATASTPSSQTNGATSGSPNVTLSSTA